MRCFSSCHPCMFLFTGTTFSYKAILLSFNMQYLYSSGKAIARYFAHGFGCLPWSPTRYQRMAGRSWRTIEVRHITWLIQPAQKKPCDWFATFSVKLKVELLCQCIAKKIRDFSWKDIAEQPHQLGLAIPLRTIVAGELSRSAGCSASFLYISGIFLYPWLNTWLGWSG